jgi:hypothetical protein
MGPPQLGKIITLAGQEVLAPAPLNERRGSHDARWLSFALLIIPCRFLFLSCSTESQLRERG